MLKIRKLEKNNCYTVKRISVHGRESLLQDEPFLNLSVIEGEGRIDGHPIRKGDHFILPADYGKFTMDGDLELIASHV